MTLRKYLEVIRGWLPKEPSFANSKKTKMVEVNRTRKPTKTGLAMYCIAIFAITFCTLSVLTVLGLGSYGPFAAGAVAALAGTLAAAVSSVLLWKPRYKSSKHSK